MSNGRCQCGAYTDSSSGLCDDCIGRGQVFDSSGFVGFADELAKGACDEQRTIAAQASALAAAQEEIERLRDEIGEAREACPIVRRQDYCDASLLTAVNHTVSQLFQMQSRAERAEQSLRENDEERTHMLDAIKGFAGGWFGFGVVTLTEAVEHDSSASHSSRHHSARRTPRLRGCGHWRRKQRTDGRAMRSGRLSTIKSPGCIAK